MEACLEIVEHSAYVGLIAHGISTPETFENASLALSAFFFALRKINTALNAKYFPIARTSNHRAELGSRNFFAGNAQQIFCRRVDIIFLRT
jgi:hypothetical protein